MRESLDERFGGPDLDRDVWFPHYLPHWSSRGQAAASYDVAEKGLRLFIPAEQGLWCAGLHPEPLRVSAIQSGALPGQQPFEPGLEILDDHEPFWGYTPTYGHVEITMRGSVSPRSMVAFWLSGIERRADESGEICVAEIFGDAIRDGTTAVGVGVHSFRDPRLREEFATEKLAIDVAEPHIYAVDWLPGSVAFSIDGDEVRRLRQSFDYPAQLMMGVFDFPGKDPAGRWADHVPELLVTHVTHMQR